MKTPTEPNRSGKTLKYQHPLPPQRPKRTHSLPTLSLSALSRPAANPPSAGETVPPTTLQRHRTLPLAPPNLPPTAPRTSSEQPSTTFAPSSSTAPPTHPAVFLATHNVAPPTQPPIQVRYGAVATEPALTNMVCMCKQVAQMAELKKILYGKFKDSINLERRHCVDY
ncbi:hypothetical protein AHAS_Ahas02G0177900 [Arachis hypogaea]